MVAKVICPRCAAPLRGAGECCRCGPIVCQVLDPGRDVRGTPWPEASRRLDDVAPRAGYRRRALAGAAIVGAAALLVAALL